MPKIYDNIENQLTRGLNETFEVSNHSDFYVGYFNLRGWKEVSERIDVLSGQNIIEGKEEIHRTCQLLVGMQKMSLEITKDHFANPDDPLIDQAEALN